MKVLSNNNYANQHNSAKNHNWHDTTCWELTKWDGVGFWTTWRQIEPVDRSEINTRVLRNPSHRRQPVGNLWCHIYIYGVEFMRNQDKSHQSSTIQTRNIGMQIQHPDHLAICHLIWPLQSYALLLNFGINNPSGYTHHLCSSRRKTWKVQAWMT